MSIHRRTVLKGLAGVPLATVLGDALISRAVAQTTEMVETRTEDGRSVRGALALPQAQKAPAMLLVHEWWGLNDQIKSVAAELARLGYVALAVDMYGGFVTQDRRRAARLAAKRPPAEALHYE